MASYIDHITGQLVRQATAGTVQQTHLGRVPFDGVISQAEITPALAVTADPTNNRIFTIFNRGQAGAGTVILATFTTSTAWVDNVPINMTLTATVADRNVLRGDRLEVVETVGGTGVAHGGALIDVSITRNDQ